MQGLYSLSGKTSYRHGKTSYRQISWSLEAAWLDVAMVVAALPRYLPNLEKFKPESRGFETSRDLAVKRLTA